MLTLIDVVIVKGLGGRENLDRGRIRKGIAIGERA